MRRLLVFAVAGLMSAFAVASCGQGGTGVGTAPSPPGACPATPPSGACSKLQVCAYPVCATGAVNCPQTETVAYCDGRTWTVTNRGDGGSFADAVIPEIAVDSASDAEETSETDGEVSLDSSMDSDLEAEADAPTTDSDAGD